MKIVTQLPVTDLLLLDNELNIHRYANARYPNNNSEKVFWCHVDCMEVNPDMEVYDTGFLYENGDIFFRWFGWTTIADMVNN